jgi:hypothetical protein
LSDIEPADVGDLGDQRVRLAERLLDRSAEPVHPGPQRMDRAEQVDRGVRVRDPPQRRAERRGRNLAQAGCDRRRQRLRIGVGGLGDEQRGERGGDAAEAMAKGHGRVHARRR